MTFITTKCIACTLVKVFPSVESAIFNSLILGKYIRPDSAVWQLHTPDTSATGKSCTILQADLDKEFVSAINVALYGPDGKVIHGICGYSLAADDR